MKKKSKFITFLVSIYIAVKNAAPILILFLFLKSVSVSLTSTLDIFMFSILFIILLLSILGAIFYPLEK